MKVTLIEVLQHVMESIVKIWISDARSISPKFKLLPPLIVWRVLWRSKSSSFDATRKDSWALPTSLGTLSPSSLTSNHILVVLDRRPLLHWSGLSRLSFCLYLLLATRQIQKAIETWDSRGRSIDGLILIRRACMGETLMQSLFRVWVNRLTCDLLVWELVIKEAPALFGPIQWWCFPAHCCREGIVLSVSRLDSPVTSSIGCLGIGLFIEVEHVSIWVCYSLSVRRLPELLDLLGLVEVTHVRLGNPLIHHWLGHLLFLSNRYSLHILLWLMGINYCWFQVCLLLLSSTTVWICF